MPVIAGRMAKDHFQDNFRQGGFVNGGLHQMCIRDRVIPGGGQDQYFLQYLAVVIRVSYYYCHGSIFRFTPAGSEVSALLGRMPSAVGYQPTLATEMGNLQERITSTRKGSITSVQAV